MSNDIEKIVRESTFAIHEGRYVYAKVSEVPHGDGHFTIARDADEITVVTKGENVKDLALLEKNKDFYRLIALNVSVPFYSVGFLATVSQAIAKEGMNILIISTYSKDYLLVREDTIDSAKDVLLNLGFSDIR